MLAREAYSLYVERESEGADEADGPFSDGMDSSRDLNGIECHSRLASKIALEGGVG